MAEQRPKRGRPRGRKSKRKPMSVRLDPALHHITSDQVMAMVRAQDARRIVMPRVPTSGAKNKGFMLDPDVTAWIRGQPARNAEVVRALIYEAHVSHL